MSDESFFGRWSRRKEAAREGQGVPAEPVAKAVPRAPLSTEGGRSNALSPLEGPVRRDPPPVEGRGGGIASPAASPGPGPGAGADTRDAGTTAPPTLADTETLTPDSDFTRYTRANVAPDVKNAAFRKLFADPHFNRMDGLDVYIDDYSKPDPLPPEMLRQMASARFLKLFDDEPQESSTDPARDAAAPGPREAADAQAAPTVAQSQPATPCDPAVPAPAATHADPDLRLQQDDAAGPPVPRPGPR